MSMPGFAKIFQDEVRRLAKKEAKALSDKLQADVAALKKSNVELKRQVADLERAGKRLKKVVAKVGEGENALETPEVSTGFYTGKTIRAMRKKLGLTQVEFGMLAGVGGQSVYHWEARDDRINIRGAAKGNLAVMKKMGKREAQARLDELSQ